MSEECHHDTGKLKEWQDHDSQGNLWKFTHCRDCGFQSGKMLKRRWKN